MKLQRGVIKAPEFRDLVWVNSPPLSLEDLRGRPTLVFFWDYVCINCLHALAYAKVWYGRYVSKGLTVVGILAPEFPFGKDFDHARQAVEELGLQFPVALDREFATADAYSSRLWPSTYLIDGEGYLSDWHRGARGYRETEVEIQGLLREQNPRVLLPQVIEPLRPEDCDEAVLRPVTPDVYLGYRRGRIGNREGFHPDGPIHYEFPADFMRDVPYAEGEFFNLPDCLMHVGPGEGRVFLSYEALEVYVVAKPGEDRLQSGFFVEQDGRPPSVDEAGEHLVIGTNEAFVLVDAPRIYHIISNSRCGRHQVTFRTESAGLRLYCVSFVSCRSA